MKTTALSLKGNYQTALALAIIAGLLSATGVLAATTSGTLDTSFGRNGVVIADLGSASDSGGSVVLQPDGKILLTGSAQIDPDNTYHRTPFLLRYNSYGAVDGSFGTNGRIVTEIGTFSGSRVAVQADGKILAGGSLGADLAVARFNSAGALDTTFGTNGIASLHFSGDVYLHTSDVAIQPDGKIILAGTEEIGNYAYFIIARFNSNGTLDVTFNERGFQIAEFPNQRFNYATAVVVQGDGKIVMSGHMQDFDGYGPKISLARFNPDGSLDTTFDTDGMVATDFNNFQSSGSLLLQSDGKLVVAGTSFGDTADDLGVARFNSNGSLDTTFGTTGIVITDFGNSESASDVALQPDGRIVVVGKNSDPNIIGFLLVRYNSNGSLDTSFGTAGKVVSDLGGSGQSANGVVLQPGGKILVSGSSNGNAVLARYYGTASSVTPVTVTFRSQGPNDGWLLESSENSNLGGTFNKLATTINVGDNEKDRQYRGLLSFNTTSIPDTAVITSAQVRVKRQGLVGTDPFTTHGLLRLQIRQGAFSNSLALQVTDFSAPATPGSINNQFSAVPTLNWYRSTLSGLNLGFINKAGPTQFRLLFTVDDNDDLSADYVKFFSGNSDISRQPQLVITYFVP